ncbi:hypothetical protein ABZ484_11470 [Streptomyces sp. NPDC006393]|uniref:hypothetical protein n=1 Tax=Streptomyces sp. NPDC006393 TaxID=3156763 RepID=UPI0033F60A03
MTINGGGAVALPRAGPVAAAPAPRQDESSTSDLVLPLVAVGTAVVLAGYGYVRRTRRVRTRTTPGGGPGGGPAPPPGPSPSAALEERARDALVLADDCVLTCHEELGFAEDRFGAEAIAPFARAVRAAEAELAAAFGMRRRYDHGLPADTAGRRQALAGMIGRCEETGRLLDAAADGFDELRGLRRGAGGALEVAEARFRELTGRTAAAGPALAALGERYGPEAVTSVTGYVEQAKDRLVFATSRLNRARQTADLGSPSGALPHLRAAEGAVAQAGVLVGAVERLATELSSAARLVPAALTGAEARLARIRPGTEAAAARLGGGPARAAVTAPVPGESSGGPVPGGPPGTAPDSGAAGSPASSERARADAPAAAGRAPAVVPGGVGGTGPGAPEAPRGPAAPRAAGVASEVVPVDLPVGELRARLGHADRVLAGVREELVAGPYDPLDALRRIVRAVAPVPVGGGRAGVLSAAAELVARSATAGAADFVATHRAAVGVAARTHLAEARRLLDSDPEAADSLSRQARDLAEQDVRVHGNPYAGDTEPAAGIAGALLGGVLLGEEPDGGPPTGFGGPHTRGRWRTPA